MRFIRLTAIYALVVLCIFQNVCAAVMYAPNGETAEIADDEIKKWQADGWYREPVVTIYAPDGRKSVVYESEKATYFALGWYEEEVVTLYSPDGEKKIVAVAEKESYINNSWYEKPVVTVYAPDGRKAVIYEYEKKTYLALGWSDKAGVTLYAPDGRKSVVYEHEKETYLALGWYEYPVQTVYSVDGNSKIVEKSRFDSYKADGWYIEPVTTVVALDGRKAVIYKSELSEYVYYGWIEFPLAYTAKIAEYADALSNRVVPYSNASVNSDMIRYALCNDAEIRYTLYDVDKNGVPELIFGDESGKLIDIYTVKSNSAVKLFDKCDFGTVNRLHILSDGTLLTESKSSDSCSSYTVSKFAADGYTLHTSGKFYYEIPKYGVWMEYSYLSYSEYAKKLNLNLEKDVSSKFNWIQL